MYLHAETGKTLFDALRDGFLQCRYVFYGKVYDDVEG